MLARTFNSRVDSITGITRSEVSLRVGRELGRARAHNAFSRKMPG